MKVIVYLPAADERALTEEGHDPARWVRDVVKAALSERAGVERRQSEAAQTRSESDEIRTDFKTPAEKKKGRR